LIDCCRTDSEFCFVDLWNGSLECCGFAHPGEPGIHPADLEQHTNYQTKTMVWTLECRSTPDLQPADLCVPGCSVLCFVTISPALLAGMECPSSSPAAPPTTGTWNKEEHASLF